MMCRCGQTFTVSGVDEIDSTTYFARFACESCDAYVGGEGNRKEVALLMSQPYWTDEALHVMDRLPPYIASLYRDEVESYANATGNNLVTFDFLGEVKNQGTVSWSPETLGRLERIPDGIRAMARVELERTALERGMAEVTASLMDEIKARYFGLGQPTSPA